MVLRALLFVLALPLAAAAQSSPSWTEVLPDTALFAYDASAPLEEGYGAPAEGEGFTRFELSWASPDGGRVPAWLWVPDGDGPHPAIVMLHGMPGSRNTLVPLAEEYARSGAVVLAPSAAFARPDPLYREPALFTLPTFDGVDRLELGQTVKDLRRGVDLLLSRGEVDPARIAYLGVSYGGWIGAVLSGVEPRIGVYALAVAPTSLAARFPPEREISPLLFGELNEARRTAWTTRMASLDGRHFVARSAPARFRFDVGLRDELVSLEDALALAGIAGSRGAVHRWDAGHALLPDAWLAQAEWLAPILGLEVSGFSPPDYR